jgi:hypothetical protein
MELHVEFDRETAAVQALALRVLADRLESGELHADALDRVAFRPARA